MDLTTICEKFKNERRPYSEKLKKATVKLFNKGISPDEIIDYFGISKRSLYRWAKQINKKTKKNSSKSKLYKIITPTGYQINIPLKEIYNLISKIEN